MRGKTLLYLAFALLMILAAMPALKASPSTSMEVLFVAINDVPITTPTSHLKGPPPNKGDDITVAIHITDVVDLWTWKVRVTWGTRLLQHVGSPWEGEFHPASPTMFLGVPSPGMIPELSSTSMAVPKTGVSGSGNLAYIKFHVEDNVGETYIRLHDVDVEDTTGASITVDPITDGLLELPPPPPTPPIARFTPEHCTFVYVCTNITLDARASEGGWDNIPLPEPIPIQNYTWEIEFTKQRELESITPFDPANPICTYFHEIAPVASNEWHLQSWNDTNKNGILDADDIIDLHLVWLGPGEAMPPSAVMWAVVKSVKPGYLKIMQYLLILEGELLAPAFHCLTPGDVTITLTVYAPDPTPHPDYYPYDSETHTIHVIGWREIEIDVYTDRGGEGPGYDYYYYPEEPYPYPISWSDAYGPQEEVTVYAFVVYDDPVEHKLVAFEVKDPNGTTRVTRTAFTNAEGIAETKFRIPWEGSEAESMFGAWSIIGTVDIAENMMKDVCKFKFGYILNIADVIVSGSPLHKTDPLSIQADIDNLSWLSKKAFLTIVLYDDVGVPIGMATDTITVAGEDGLTAIYTITIPDWAFIGVGAAYVNLYTAQPSLGGTPWCPERSAIFIIEKA